ncbi:MAG TPA: cation-transporting P-type ATPase [Oligoflexia bacterium]|nr:cation-transporting P-type ATPase [Oligoflexia bacterium]HMR24314.1 cation-transporting P-type ATPase [Oligoflexia bacterium]
MNRPETQSKLQNLKHVSFVSLQNIKRHEGGLTSSEVLAQRARFGANDIVKISGNKWLELAAETVKDPMIWFLVGVGTVFIMVNNLSDAITLFVAIIPLVFMDAFLHWRTQASTSDLRKQLSSKVEVIRESKKVEIDSLDLVPGDIVVVHEGLFLPADGIFEHTQNIQVDESALTGEAFPIPKTPAFFDPFSLSSMKVQKISSEHLAYAGTKVLTGQGVFRVLWTGKQTSYGEIVQSISYMPSDRTPFQKSISKLVQILTYAAVIFCILLATIRIYQGYSWLDALLSAATLAVAAIPEEFPVVFTFFLSVGVYRLAKHNVLVRRAVSVENIGRVTQVCTDKTGTITLGNLSLTHIDPKINLSENDLVTMASFASSSDFDPIDIAIRRANKKEKSTGEEKVKTVPFTEDRKRETVFVKGANGQYIVYSKGSPEVLLSISKMSEIERKEWEQKITHWAKSGHKVLGCAQKQIASIDENDEPESNFEFCGLLAFEDPPRPGVAEAMNYCRKSGIHILMITGDHPDTAIAIAKDSKLVIGEPRIISAWEEPEKFEEDWIYSNARFLRELDIVARCTPMQKMRIVKALKGLGELVAVTGDGINDVPALKSADIGIAMGARGTKSAREVSSIILTDDNFSTIINAIREGRQLYLNLKTSFTYLLLIHIPLVLTAALIPLGGYPLLYLPIHIVWLELIIHPTALFAFQFKTDSNREKHVHQNTFFSVNEVLWISFFGLVVTIILGLSFFFGLNEGLGLDHARAKAMAILTMWSVGITIFFTGFRSRVANILSLGIVVISMLIIQSSKFFPSLHLLPLNWVDWLEILSFVGGVLLMFKVKKIRSIF